MKTISLLAAALGTALGALLTSAAPAAAATTAPSTGIPEALWCVVEGPLTDPQGQQILPQTEICVPGP